MLSWADIIFTSGEVFYLKYENLWEKLISLFELRIDGVDFFLQDLKTSERNKTRQPRRMIGKARETPPSVVPSGAVQHDLGQPPIAGPRHD